MKTMEKGLKQLSFIAGSWISEGILVDFTEPVYSMIFGSMQAVNEQGAVVHWETFRFEEKDNNVFLYPAQRGRESGSYLLNEKNEGETFVFEAFFNNHSSIKEIYFEKKNEGKELTFGVNGEADGREIKKEWNLKKR
ncbi:hypothetical protein V7114_05590 [Neobacillus niacini]|uniref:hypothetical protein n=1 Tax=Neobacillus niacini TaxID=86668 RepID=UPI0030001149